MPIDIITGKWIEPKVKTEVKPEVVKTEPKKEISEAIKEVLEGTQHQHQSNIDKSSEWTNVQVDSQVLSIFMACPRKYEYVFKRRLVPIDGVSKSITRGSIVHDALLSYWSERIKSGDSQVATQSCIRKAKEKLDQEIKFGSDEKLEILQNLLEFVKYVQNNSWIPLEAEKYFMFKAFEDEIHKVRIYLTGRIDLVMRAPQLPVVPIDVKTESERWFYTQMSNQFKIYCLATGANLLGVQRVGFQAKLEPKDKFKLELLPFDQDILDEFRTITLPYWVKQMILAHEDNFFPMNPSNCVHGHFKCQFSDAYNGGICNISRSVREQKIGRYFVIGEEWNPKNI